MNDYQPRAPHPRRTAAVPAQSPSSGDVTPQARNPERSIRTGKDTGLGRFPSHDFAINTAWLTAAMTAVVLLAWLKLLALGGDLAKAEPKTLRYPRLEQVRGGCESGVIDAVWIDERGVGDLMLAIFREDHRGQCLAHDRPVGESGELCYVRGVVADQRQWRGEPALTGDLQLQRFPLRPCDVVGMIDPATAKRGEYPAHAQTGLCLRIRAVCVGHAWGKVKRLGRR